LKNAASHRFTICFFICTANADRLAAARDSKMKQGDRR